jgi:hypothetical protein
VVCLNSCTVTRQSSLPEAKAIGTTGFPPTAAIRLKTVWTARSNPSDAPILCRLTSCRYSWSMVGGTLQSVTGHESVLLVDAALL